MNDYKKDLFTSIFTYSQGVLAFITLQDLNLIVAILGAFIMLLSKLKEIIISLQYLVMTLRGEKTPQSIEEKEGVERAAPQYEKEDLETVKKLENE
jgi:hypothetical protein